MAEAFVLEPIAPERSAADAARVAEAVDASVYSLLSDADIPFAFEGAPLHADASVVERFKNRCFQIGKQLAQQMSDKGAEEAAAEAPKRALGYGNRGMLLVSPFNVPTQCLTALWGSGLIDGVPWEPLMARRKKT